MCEIFVHIWRNCTPPGGNLESIYYVRSVYVLLTNPLCPAKIENIPLVSPEEIFYTYQKEKNDISSDASSGTKIGSLPSENS